MSIENEFCTFENLSEKDLEGALEVYSTCTGDIKRTNISKDCLEGLLINHDYNFFVAKIGGTVIGVIQTTIIHTIFGDCSSYMLLENLCVSTNFRNKGIGTKLLNYAVEFALKNNIKSIRSSIGGENMNSLSVHKKVNFTYNHTLDYVYNGESYAR